MMTQSANSLRLAAFLGVFSLLLFGCSSCIDRKTVDITSTERNDINPRHIIVCK